MCRESYKRRLLKRQWGSETLFNFLTIIMGFGFIGWLSFLYGGQNTTIFYLCFTKENTRALYILFFFICTTTQGSRILFRFNSLKLKKSMKCLKDHVEIIDTTNGRIVGKFCRKRQVDGTTGMLMSGSTAIVRFRATSKKTRSGFSLSYQPGEQKTKYNCPNKYGFTVFSL